MKKIVKTIVILLVFLLLPLVLINSASGSSIIENSWTTLAISSVNVKAILYAIGGVKDMLVQEAGKYVPILSETT